MQRSPSPAPSGGLPASTRNADRPLFRSYRQAILPGRRKSRCHLLAGHSPQCKDEISAWAGCEVVLIDDPHITIRPGWRLCVLTGTKYVGFLPEKLLVRSESLATASFYFENFANSKRDVEKWLSLHCNNGAYLVWADDKEQHFVLSNRNNYCQIRHCPVGELGENFFLNLSHLFKNLSDLIDFYKERPGLFCKPLHLKEVAPRPKWNIVPPMLCCSGSTQINRSALELDTTHRIGFCGRVYVGNLSKAPVHVSELGHGQFRLDDVKLDRDMLDRLTTLRHVCIHNILGVWCPSSSRKALLVSEAVEPYCTLSSYLDEGSTHLSKLACSDILCQVASAMEYLSQCSFVHTALNDQHILIEHDYRVKVTDLHLGGFQDSPSLKQRHRWPLCLRSSAPELIAGRDATTKCDVWSFGILMNVLFGCGRRPFDTMTDHALVTAFLKVSALSTAEIAPAPPAKLPEFLISFYNLCVAESPSIRPSFELVHHVLEQFVLEVYHNAMD